MVNDYYQTCIQIYSPHLCPQPRPGFFLPFFFTCQFCKIRGPWLAPNGFVRKKTSLQQPAELVKLPAIDDGTNFPGVGEAGQGTGQTKSPTREEGSGEKGGERGGSSSQRVDSNPNKSHSGSSSSSSSSIFNSSGGIGSGVNGGSGVSGGGGNPPAETQPDVAIVRTTINKSCKISISTTSQPKKSRNISTISLQAKVSGKKKPIKLRLLPPSEEGRRQKESPSTIHINPSISSSSASVNSPFGSGPCAAVPSTSANNEAASISKATTVSLISLSGSSPSPSPPPGRQAAVEIAVAVTGSVGKEEGGGEGTKGLTADASTVSTLSLQENADGTTKSTSSSSGGGGGPSLASPESIASVVAGGSKGAAMGRLAGARGQLLKEAEKKAGEGTGGKDEGGSSRSIKSVFSRGDAGDETGYDGSVSPVNCIGTESTRGGEAPLEVCKRKRSSESSNGTGTAGNSNSGDKESDEEGGGGSGVEGVEQRPLKRMS